MKFKKKTLFGVIFCISAALAGCSNMMSDQKGDKSAYSIEWHIVWTAGEPDFQNSWTNDTSGDFQKCRFGKDKLGYIHIQGRVKSGADNNVVFTLTGDYCPAHDSQYIAAANGSYAIVTVQADGAVRVSLETDAGSDNRIDLRDIRFLAGNDSVNTVDWHDVGITDEPAFQNSWVNDTSGDYQSCRFGEDALGYVYIDGRVTGGSDDSVVFTLPEDFRPDHEYQYIVAANTSYAIVTVQTDGDVYIVMETDAGSSNRASFGNIAFQSVDGSVSWKNIGTTDFMNSWENDTSGSYQSCRFGKDTLGFIHIEGRAAGGSTGSTVFTLPGKYRSDCEYDFIIPANNSYATVTVGTGGDIYVILETNAGSGNWLNFSSVTFVNE